MGSSCKIFSKNRSILAKNWNPHPPVSVNTEEGFVKDLQNKKCTHGKRLCLLCFKIKLYFAYLRQILRKDIFSVATAFDQGQCQPNFPPIYHTLILNVGYVLRAIVRIVFQNILFFILPSSAKYMNGILNFANRHQPTLHSVVQDVKQASNSIKKGKLKIIFILLPFKRCCTTQHFLFFLLLHHEQVRRQKSGEKKELEERFAVS